MNNRNLTLIFSAGAVLVILAVLVPTLQNQQEMRQRAAEQKEQQAAKQQPHLTPQVYRNRQYQNINVSITLPPIDKRFLAPNDTIPPKLTITSPQIGTAVSAGSTIQITAQATDNIAVSSVEFLVNGQTICTQTASPYTCSWTVPTQSNTQYLIVVRAMDATGNLTSKSLVVLTK